MTPPTMRSTTPIGSQSQTDKGNREKFPQRVREEGRFLGASAQGVLKASGSSQELGMVHCDIWRVRAQQELNPL